MKPSEFTAYLTDLRVRVNAALDAWKGYGEGNTLAAITAEEFAWYLELADHRQDSATLEVIAVELVNRLVAA